MTHGHDTNMTHERDAQKCCTNVTHERDACSHFWKPETVSVFTVLCFQKHTQCSGVCVDAFVQHSVVTDCSERPAVCLHSLSLSVHADWVCNTTARRMTAVTTCLWAASCLRRFRPPSTVTTGRGAAGGSCTSTCSEYCE